MRIQNEGTGKSSWWIMNPDVSRTVKTVRRPRAMTMDTTGSGGARLVAAYERHRRRSSAAQLHNSNRVASSSSLSSSSPLPSTTTPPSSSATGGASSGPVNVQSLSSPLQHSYSSSGIDRLPPAHQPHTHHHHHHQQQHHFMLPAPPHHADTYVYGPPASDFYGRARAASFGSAVQSPPHPPSAHLGQEMAPGVQFSMTSSSSGADFCRPSETLSETLADIFAGDLSMDDGLGMMSSDVPQPASSSSSVLTSLISAGVTTAGRQSINDGYSSQLSQHMNIDNSNTGQSYQQHHNEVSMNGPPGWTTSSSDLINSRNNTRPLFDHRQSYSPSGTEGAVPPAPGVLGGQYPAMGPMNFHPGHPYHQTPSAPIYQRLSTMDNCAEDGSNASGGNYHNGTTYAGFWQQQQQHQISGQPWSAVNWHHHQQQQQSGSGPVPGQRPVQHQGQLAGLGVGCNLRLNQAAIARVLSTRPHLMEKVQRLIEAKRQQLLRAQHGQKQEGDEHQPSSPALRSGLINTTAGTDAVVNTDSFLSSSAVVTNLDQQDGCIFSMLPPPTSSSLFLNDVDLNSVDLTSATDVMECDVNEVIEHELALDDGDLDFSTYDCLLQLSAGGTTPSATLSHQPSCSTSNTSSAPSDTAAATISVVDAN